MSIFVFEKKLADKLHKPRRKETVTEILKKSVHYLEMLRQPKLILKVVHSVEDCNETLAFAAEPVIASLANILAYQASIGGRAVNGPPSTGASITTAAMPRPSHAREYNFLDFEIKYGIRQVGAQLVLAASINSDFSRHLKGDFPCNLNILRRSKKKIFFYLLRKTSTYLGIIDNL